MEFLILVIILLTATAIIGSKNKAALYPASYIAIKKQIEEIKLLEQQRYIQDHFNKQLEDV